LGTILLHGFGRLSALFCKEICNILLGDAIFGLFSSGIQLVGTGEMATRDVESHGSGLDFQNLGDLGNGKIFGFTHKHLGFLGKRGKYGIDVKYHD
jgi:hypothetical protein